MGKKYQKKILPKYMGENMAMEHKNRIVFTVTTE